MHEDMSDCFSYQESSCLCHLCQSVQIKAATKVKLVRNLLVYGRSRLWDIMARVSPRDKIPRPNIGFTLSNSIERRFCQAKTSARQKLVRLSYYTRSKLHKEKLTI
jgi:hypothetical protein